MVVIKEDLDGNDVNSENETIRKMNQEIHSSIILGYNSYSPDNTCRK